MDSHEHVLEQTRKKTVAAHRTVPTAIVALVCAALLPLYFDEKNFAGWMRLAEIWGSALGYCVLTAVTGYWINRLRKSKPGPILSKVVSAICLLICGWILILGVRDTRRALDPNRWLEIRVEYAHLPYEVEPGDTIYTLNLAPDATDGLEAIRTQPDQTVLWPDDHQSGRGRDPIWWGWHCTIQNRGMQTLSEISFDIPVEYSLRRPGAENVPDRTVHHVRIPTLAPNQSIHLLLGTTQEDWYIDVYKPQTVLARSGNAPGKHTLRTLWLPFDKMWDREDDWFLTGPE